MQLCHLYSSVYKHVVSTSRKFLKVQLPVEENVASRGDVHVLGAVKLVKENREGFMSQHVDGRLVFFIVVMSYFHF